MSKSDAAKMTVDEYRDKLHDYRQDYLLCKDIRHVWRLVVPYTTDTTAESGDTAWVHRVLECDRCGTTRTDNFRLLANTGRMQRGYSTYRYPAGFSMRRLPDVKNHSEIMRFESYLRAMQTANTIKEKKKK